MTYTNQKQFKNSINVLWWMVFRFAINNPFSEMCLLPSQEPKLSKMSPGFEPATSSWRFFFLQNIRWTRSRLGSLRPGASCSATEIRDPDLNRTRRRKPDQVSSRDQVSRTKSSQPSEHSVPTWYCQLDKDEDEFRSELGSLKPFGNFKFSAYHLMHA